MTVSIVIVSFNVKHFLEQCLLSVQKAATGIAAEIIVVDNHSTDHSLLFLKPRFPSVKFISNTTNVGFAKACNQGLQQASGSFILFLNPDCLLPEDCIQKCLDFFSQHPGAGALGVRMLDGHGRYLKESKRAFPSPRISFFKLTGLARVFPRSKIFGRYHLGHLDACHNHEVDVLAGAFMMIPNIILDQVGSFDETFFMYGEDIDLSYRIQKAGYKNYYIADTEIIHFKGESTKKGSLNYVRMFYKAMSLFVQKHYGGSRAGFFNFFIQAAIWFRAIVSATGHFFKSLGLPLLDAVLIICSFILVKNFWTSFIKTQVDYPGQLLFIAFPVFTGLYLLAAYYGGLYDRYYKRSDLFGSLLAATLVLLATYALLPEHLRFSRGIIFFGAVLSFALISISRSILLSRGLLPGRTSDAGKPQVLVAATAGEYERLSALLDKTGRGNKLLGRIAVEPGDATGVGHIDSLEKLWNTIPVKEIIFCGGYLPIKKIIHFSKRVPARINIKYHIDQSLSVIGSDHRNVAGEALSLERHTKLSLPYNRRLKRLVDVITAIIFLFTFPVHIIVKPAPIKFLKNCWMVFTGRNTWVGYAIASAATLPLLRPGIINAAGRPLELDPVLPAGSLQKLDAWYAENYEPLKDLKLIGGYYLKRTY